MKPSLVIALHGLGANGADLMPLQQMMGMDDVPWLFPDAPDKAVTVNMGMRMPAWFDILGVHPSDPVDASGIAESAAKIQVLISEQLAQGVDASRVVLLGFSQGGVIALHTALSFQVKLGAVIGLSTWLPAADALMPLANELKTLPVWLGHGRVDDIVPMAAHERTQVKLSQLAMRDVTCRTYAMAHTIVPEELADVTAWLHRL